MMTQKTQVRVIFDRKHTATKIAAALIQLEVRVDGERRFFSTGVKVCAQHFKNGRVVGRPDATELNDRIDAIYRRFTSLINDCIAKNVKISFDFFSHDRDNSVSFVDWMERRISERPIRKDTVRQHMMVVRFLRQEWTRISSFSDLTPQNIQSLDEYLHRRQIPGAGQMALPTIYKYHKVLKLYIHDALTSGIIEHDPYEKIKVRQGASKPRSALTLDELSQFLSFAAPTAFLQKIKDLFVVQCFTGLSYADLMETDFSRAELVNGEYVLSRETRLKTGTRFILVLLPQVLEVLGRYDFQLPHLAYDVYNRHLKAFAVMAGIKKNVTTHIGRHTFATTVALSNGVPIEVLSKMLGHTNIRTTQIYAKILPPSVVAGFKQIKNNM
jgi:integrase